METEPASEESKQSVYVETTIVSYLTARPSRDLVLAAHQQITQEWWATRRNNFDLYVSRAVIQEVGIGGGGNGGETLESD